MFLMNYYDQKRQEIKDYFNSFASQRIIYRKRRSYYWDSITKYCDFFIDPDDSSIEIGCGTGELIAQLKGKHKVGIDFSGEMISVLTPQIAGHNLKYSQSPPPVSS